MKSLLIGIGILLVGLLVGLLQDDLKTGLNISAGVGVVLLLIAGLLSGAFVSGDRMRANTATSTSEDLSGTRKWAFRLMMSGLPGFIAAVIYYAFINK